MILECFAIGFGKLKEIFCKLKSEKKNKNQKCNNINNLQDISKFSGNKKRYQCKNKQGNHRKRPNKANNIFERNWFLLIELNIEQGTRNACFSRKSHLVNEKTIIDRMIIIISIYLSSLDNRCSICLLKRIFNIHINTENANKSNLLQKINVFREKIIAITVLQSKFRSIAFYRHSFVRDKILSHFIQKAFKKQKSAEFFLF